MDVSGFMYLYLLHLDVLKSNQVPVSALVWNVVFLLSLLVRKKKIYLSIYLSLLESPMSCVPPVACQTLAVSVALTKTRDSKIVSYIIATPSKEFMVASHLVSEILCLSSSRIHEGMSDP